MFLLILCTSDLEDKLTKHLFATLAAHIKLMLFIILSMKNPLDK